jgi:hypothetical protein
MADRSMFRTAVRPLSAWMDVDLGTLHALVMAGEVVDEGSRRLMSATGNTPAFRLFLLFASLPQAC